MENGPFNGIPLFGSDSNTIDRNFARGNSVVRSLSVMVSSGIELGIVGRARGSHFNAISNNVVRGDGFDEMRFNSAPTRTASGSTWFRVRKRVI